MSEFLFKMATKHWIGTIPKFDKDGKETTRFWENPNTLEHIQYIKLQEEEGHGTTAYRHYQVYICLKKIKRLTWLKKHIHPTAHWEKKRGTVAEAIDYVSKEDTRVPDGIQFEYGEKPQEKNEASHEAAAANRLRDKDDIQLQCQEILQRLNSGEFIAWKDVPADVQMKPGFLLAYKMATKDMVGPERPDLKIITLIGPPGCGKSYAISKLFPKAGRWLKGNSGQWFCNAKSDVMVFEEFSGQIDIQSMLKYLDPYPLALEVKGGTEPAMYKLVIITSNTDIEDWYTKAEEFKANPADPLAQTSSKRRRTDALGALWDRLGYKSISRTCGAVFRFQLIGGMGPEQEQIKAMRQEIMRILTHAKEEMLEQQDTQPDEPYLPSLPAAQDPNADFEIEELSSDKEDSDSDGEIDALVEAANALSENEE